MPKLRKVGQAFTNIGEGLARLTPILLQDKLSKERILMEHEQQMERQRRSEEAIRQRTNSNQAFGAEAGLLDDLLKGSLSPDAFSTEFQEKVNVQGMRPTPETVLSPLMSDVAGAKDLGSLTPASTLRSQAAQKLGQAGYETVGGPKFVPRPAEGGSLPGSGLMPGARPEIEDLIHARSSQHESIVNEIERGMDAKFAEARGTAYNTAMGTGQAKTELFPGEMQRGLMQKSAENQMDVDQFARMTPLEVQRAGQVEATRQAIQRRYSEWLDPNIIAAKLKFEADKAQQISAMNRDAAHKEAVDNALVGMNSVQQDLANLADLSKKVNTGASTLEQVPEYLGSRAQTNTDANILDTKARAVAMKIVNAFGWNKGATSENDVNSILALLPTSINTKDIAEKRIADFNAMLHKTIVAMNQAPPGMPLLDRINVGRRVAGLAPWTPQDFQTDTPPTPYRDPTSILEQLRQSGVKLQ